jgi:hypothetical protein
MNWKTRNRQNFGCKTSVKRSLWGSCCRWVDNIVINLRERSYKELEIEFAEDKAQSQACNHSDEL